MGELPQRDPWWRRLFRNKARSSPRAASEPPTEPIQPAAMPKQDRSKPQSCSHDFDLSPDQDLAIARDAIVQGDLKHAAHHIACAALVAPMDEETIAMMNRLIDASEDPLSLAPLAQDNYAGTVALRAYILGRQGHLQDAIGLISQITDVFRPSQHWRWIARWLHQAKDVPAGACLSLCGAMLRRFPGDHFDEDARREMTDFESLIAAMRSRLPDLAEIACLQAMIVRKLGRYEESLAIANKVWETSKSYMSAIPRAMALRQMKRVEEAAAAYHDAMQFEPEDVSVRADLATLYFDAGDMNESRRWAEETVAREPEHVTGKPLALFLRGLLDRDRRAEAALRSYATEHPDGPARFLARQLEPYVGFLPTPQDATVNGIRNMRKERGPEQKPFQSLSMTISSIEAPSVRLCVYRELGVPPEKFAVTVEAFPSPDPREPQKPVSYLLWRYQGTDPIPALDPPHEYVARRVVSVAKFRYDVDQWYRAAGEVGRELGPKAVEPVLATMVHPPPAPSPEWSADVWIQHVQVAAAMILCHVDSGWQDSRRREALLSLIYGPVDWTTSAGIVALTQLCLTEPETARTVDPKQIFLDLLKNVPRRGYCCYVYALVCNALRLSGLTPAEKRELELIKTDLESET